jgi:hypothetical protein
LVAAFGQDVLYTRVHDAVEVSAAAESFSVLVLLALAAEREDVDMERPCKH